MISVGDVFTMDGRQVQATAVETKWEPASSAPITRADVRHAADRVRNAPAFHPPVDMEAVRAAAAAFHAARNARTWAVCREMTERRLSSLRHVPAWVMGVGR